MSNETKQTAVEWLIQELQKRDMDILNRDLYKQAKEMEREQSINDFKMGIRNAIQMEETKDADKWYNETYGGNK
jgi:hypothetical protein